MKTVQKRVLKPMTDRELEKYIGLNKIVKYSDLDESFNSIYELLPLPIDFRIVLFETDFNFGHWICVIRNDPLNEFLYIDPYGTPLGSLYGNNSNKKNVALGNVNNALMNLLNTRSHKSKLIINTYPFQSKTNSSETCGRWIILILKLYLHYGYSLKYIYDFLQNKQNEMHFHDLDSVAAYYII
jgi:hypothetical protein